MATLSDGTRVFSAADAAQILAADHNQLQDILIALFEQRRSSFWQGTPCNDPAVVPNFNDWDVRGPGTGAVIADTGFWFWESAGNDMEIVFPLTGLLVGQVITEIIVIVGGNTTATGGTADLYYGAPASNMSSTNIDGVANMFDPGGALDESDPIVYTVSAAPFPLTVTSSYSYFVHIRSSAANGAGNRIYDVIARTQFGA